ncbi:hypothetical protein CAEBREN_28486 [Caenorhabditis brenneri]|uniref:Serpentine receptor class gamma n=1 Tax=Caenorhabditis brenneri TaxID=135651 RepID=G0N2T1_CAEBE|nr:hypothetical protein CAEBREN_28486 [Caenorhabditis brenneri]
MLAKLPSFENYSYSCTEIPNTVFFNRIYFLNAIYLVPTLVLNIWIFIILRIRHADFYKNNLTFSIITLDTVVAIIHIFLDLSVVRLFLYFPQFCPQFSQYFINYPIINDIIFPLYNYCRVSKTVTQSAIILSRLGCVKKPMKSDKLSRKLTPLIIPTTVFLPILVILNTVISKKEVVFWYGGFFTIYHRKFVWVSLSSLHLTFLFFAIAIFIFSSIMIVRHLPPHNELAERNCIIHAVLAVFGFSLQGFFQSYYALFRFQEWFPDFVIHGQFVIYDVMTVG